MKKNLFIIIIIFNTLALSGIFATQIYWVRESYRLKEDQFAGAIRIAIKGVANQMLNHLLLHPGASHETGTNDTDLHFPEVRDINPGLLDFKINEEFNCMQIGKGFEYAIIDKRDNQFIAGNFRFYHSRLVKSRHQIPMTGFKDSEHIVLSVYFPDERNLILMRMVNWLVLSVIFAILFVLAYLYSVYFFFRQKRLSEMKTDFINNMTHEFKTPLATISLASEMLMKKSVQEDAEKMKRYSRIIYDENSRLQSHVDQILRVSLIEKGQFRLKKKEINIHDLVNKVMESFEITIKERNAELQSHFGATQFIIFGDPMHLTNVITNLLDNANKYSPKTPEIKIGTYNVDNGIVISVEDKGLGISQEDQKHIFKNLYRVPTGNIYHKEKGFGIGLYYVKTIIEAHGGHINLKSEIDKGSRFEVFLPFIANPEPHVNKEYQETQNSTG